MAGPKVKAVLTADSTDFEKKLSHAGKTIDKTGKALKVGLVAGAAAAAAGMYALTKVMSEAVSLANEQEAAEAKLESVLQATGHAAGFNSDQLKKMAAGLQQVTTTGDETILNGMGILATFKQIKGEAFEGATKAALDMSAVMGTDLNSSVLQVGKALNDPIKGLTALSRVGVSFTEQQKEQIKTLQESGDMMGAQTIILKELESEFGGAATAMAQTFGGKVLQLQGAFSDFKEEIGFTVTKSAEFTAVIDESRLVVEALTKYVNEHRGDIAEIFLKAIESSKYAVEAVRFVHNGISGLVLAGNAVVTGFAYVFDFMVDGFRVMLKPLDLLFEGLVKLGKIESNPFDALSSAALTFKESSTEVLTAHIQKIADTNAVYDTAVQTIEGFVSRVREKSAAIKADTAETNINTGAISNNSLANIADTGAIAGNTAAKREAAAQTKAFNAAIMESSVFLGAEALAYENSADGMDGYKTAMQLAYEETKLMDELMGELTGQQDLLSASTGGLAGSYDSLAGSIERTAGALAGIEGNATYVNTGGGGSSSGGGPGVGQVATDGWRSPYNVGTGTNYIPSTAGAVTNNQTSNSNNTIINVNQKMSRADILAIAEEDRRRKARA